MCYIYIYIFFFTTSEKSVSQVPIEANSQLWTLKLRWLFYDTFGASVCLWWFGENFLDIAPYMADARAGELPLLGGNYGKSSPYGFHDWEFILGETGLLAWDKTLAALTLNSGRAIMVLAMVWGAWLLWRGWRRQRG